MSTTTAPKRVYRVKNPHQSPPGGWHWKDAQTGKIFSSDVFADVEERATGYLLSHNRDAGKVEAEIHHRTASVLMSNGNRDLCEVHGEVKRSLKQSIGGATVLMLKWWKESPIYGLIKGEAERGEDVFVDQAEADRRAGICVGCDNNVIPSGKGWVQNWADKKMLKETGVLSPDEDDSNFRDSVGGRITKHHDDLGTCPLCKCELRAACWWKPNILKAAMRLDDYESKLPSHCWKLDLDNPDPPAQ